MAHAEWCGKPCGECENPCYLDESMPCSPCCENLDEDGDPKNPYECIKAGCDAYVWDEYFCVEDIVDDAKKIAFYQSEHGIYKVSVEDAEHDVSVNNPWLDATGRFEFEGTVDAPNDKARAYWGETFDKFVQMCEDPEIQDIFGWLLEGDDDDE